MGKGRRVKEFESVWVRGKCVKGRLLTDGTDKSRTVVVFTSGKGHA